MYQQVFDHEFNQIGSRARPSIFQKGWLTYLKKLGTLVEHLAWNAISTKVVFLNPPKPYSPMILLDFNKEDYTNQPTEEAIGGDEMGTSGVADNLGAKIKASEAEARDQDIPPKHKVIYNIQGGSHFWKSL